MPAPRQPVPDVRPGMRVRLRKPHPCGSADWTVTRIGADIGLRCAGCGHHVLLTRGSFNKQFKAILEPSPEPGKPGESQF